MEYIDEIKKLEGFKLKFFKYKILLYEFCENETLEFSPDYIRDVLLK